MSLNSTPSSERVHIGFFGRRNAGKSSVVNAVTGQDMSIVSDVKGTTTDLVYKAMELLPMGPVVIIDTPGFDDEGALGELRVKKTKQALNRSDCAVLVVDGALGKTDVDEQLISLFIEKEIPYIIAYNKADISGKEYDDGMNVSGLTKANINELKDKIATLVKTGDENARLIGDKLKPNDLVVLVTPIDKAAPKGRIILPQQQTIRDILDADAMSIVVKENGLEEALASLGRKPAMVITDSQVFKTVSEKTPRDIPLTSFSILMARYKGFLDVAVEGISAIDRLKDGDKILISEGCTHHRSCNDIGTVKIPNWIKKYTGKDLVYEFSSGKGFPEDISEYSLIIHCGGCMLNEREIKYRMKTAVDAGIPFTNYGIAIAFMNGILQRSVEIFPHLAEMLKKD